MAHETGIRPGPQDISDPVPTINQYPLSAVQRLFLYQTATKSKRSAQLRHYRRRFGGRFVWLFRRPTGKELSLLSAAGLHGCSASFVRMVSDLGIWRHDNVKGNLAFADMIRVFGHFIR